jgi:transcriptional regulator with XRE-family HTH domain
MAIMHDRIKELRSKSGMTLSQIADALGTTEATAQRYESGKGIKSIPYEVIEKYANIFGCKPQYIMGWTEEIPQKNSILADLTIRMRTDSDFYSVVEGLNKLDTVQLASVKQVVDAFLSTKG